MLQRCSGRWALLLEFVEPKAHTHLASHSPVYRLLKHHSLPFELLQVNDGSILGIAKGGRIMERCFGVPWTYLWYLMERTVNREQTGRRMLTV